MNSDGATAFKAVFVVRSITSFCLVIKEILQLHLYFGSVSVEKQLFPLRIWMRDVKKGGLHDKYSQKLLDRTLLQRAFLSRR